MHHEIELGPRPKRELGDEVHILGKKIEPFWPFLGGLGERNEGIFPGFSGYRMSRRIQVHDPTSRAAAHGTQSDTPGKAGGLMSGTAS